MNADGSVGPVPTQFITVDGKKVAVLMRNGNSAYAVIENEHPAAFTDAKGLWAESHIKQLANKLTTTSHYRKLSNGEL